MIDTVLCLFSGCIWLALLVGLVMWESAAASAVREKKGAALGRLFQSLQRTSHRSACGACDTDLVSQTVCWEVLWCESPYVFEWRSFEDDFNYYEYCDDAIAVQTECGYNCEEVTGYRKSSKSAGKRNFVRELLQKLSEK